MKPIHERIAPDADSSFHLLLTPHLEDVFLWHYHPEYELVYIEGANGTRHVGSHLSRYEGSDLVFIGPNIPHLNFDYGVRTQYQKVVVQLKEPFLGGTFDHTPEFAALTKLFAQARGGISFQGLTKQQCGEQLKQLASQPPLERLLTLLRIFQQLATSDEFTLLHGQPLAGAYTAQEQRRLQVVTQFVAEHYARKIELGEAAALVHLTESAFCRYLKRLTGLTFVQFLNQFRVHQAQNLLLQDVTVSEACFACGFENLSYFTKVFHRVTGETPLRFRQRQRA